MKTSTFLSALAISSASIAAAQDFIVNGNSSNLLSCRGSQFRNDYCCFDGTFSGPAWNGPTSSSSITLVRKSEIVIRQTNNKEKRDIMTEMSSGLTCSGFAAITLTNSDASALLASATGAADDEGGSTSVGESGIGSSTSVGGDETSSAAVESVSASATSTSTNGAAMATNAPLLIVGGAALFMAFAL
ncbi:hypothetical protein IFR05_001534 [Cadophora sp. M221]|nr:hypothetical protein IFR05_001534 [Cadophora sp. M221]